MSVRYNVYDFAVGVDGVAPPPQSADVPLLIASNRTEMSMLIGAANRELFELTWDTLPAALQNSMPGVDAQAVIDGYRELHSDIDPVNLYFEAMTDTGVFGRDPRGRERAIIDAAL